MKKALILVYVFILSFSSTVSCEEKDITVLNGAVSYSLPSSWKVLDKKGADSFNAILLLIPCRDADNTPHRANATIVAEKNKENLTLEQYSSWKLERMNNEKTRLVGDKVDKSTWRSVLWRSEEKNTPYLVFDRFGVTTATRVYMRIAFPLLKDGDQKWIKNMCDEINTVTRNLKIRNENTVESMIIYEDGYIGLKDLTTSSPPKYGIYAK